MVVLGPHRRSCMLAWVLIHRSWYWALIAVRGWWYWALITIHWWRCWALVVHVVLPSSFVDGVAGHSSHYSWVVVVDPSHAVHGWWWWALVTPFMGGGGVPCWFSCAMVCGCSSLWSLSSFDGEGGGLLFVFAGAHRSSWVPVGGHCHLCPVRGGGWRRRWFAW